MLFIYIFKCFKLYMIFLNIYNFNSSHEKKNLLIIKLFWRTKHTKFEKSNNDFFLPFSYNKSHKIEKKCIFEIESRAY